MLQKHYYSADYFQKHLIPNLSSIQKYLQGKLSKKSSLQPSIHAELQIIDYCLWALQRFYEQKEDVYFNIIKDKFKLIIDADDKRNSAAGSHYHKRRALTLVCIDGTS